MKSFALSRLRSSVQAGLYATTIATALAASNTVMAQEDAAEDEDKGLETIQVTATRRSGTVQEVPINITALNDDVMKEQNIFELNDVARWVPGLTVQDQGGRSGSPIIVRGLNTNSSNPASDGGTVATYVGEIPMLVDLKLIDLERVETLIGPQGTLYGAGSLGGAIRYIPNKPETDITTFEVMGELFDIKESGSLGNQAYIIFNTPIIEDELALRISINHYDDPGFIDYNYLVREVGTSLPDPDWSDSNAVSANITGREDVNGEETLTARIALRWTPNDWFDGTLNYYVQDQEVEGRSISHFGALASGGAPANATNPLAPLVGQYESAFRVLEPREKKDELLSVEATVDLGFAELTSASGWTSFEAVGQRDQTDLLIRLNYSYEEFPAFTAFTREDDDEESFTQELRLVSTSDSDLSWIVGYFYNKTEDFGESQEFTPGYDVFVTGEELRPDSLEYHSIDDSETVEKAWFGEISYAITDKWDVTIGARFYEYEVDSVGAASFPLADTIFGGEGPDFDDLATRLQNPANRADAEDDGELFKFNTSYKFNRDFMMYFTYSEGFRIGGSNGLPPCTQEQIDGGGQVQCGLPNELLFTPDITENTELGFKSTLFDNNMTLNGAVYSIDWNNAQIDGATQLAALPIIVNASDAEAQGLELSARAILSDNLTAYATYSYTKAELVTDAPFLFAILRVQTEEQAEALGLEVGDTLQGTPQQDFYDGKAVDRLPGSPETQASLGLSYGMEVLGDKFLDITYGLTYQSDILTTVGQRNNGERLPGYSLHNIAAKLSDENWSVTLYVDNLFDKYAFISSRRTPGDVNGLRDNEFISGYNPAGPALLRNHGHYILEPRKIGLRFNYTFDM